MDSFNKVIKYHNISSKSTTDEFPLTDDYIVTEKIHGSNFAIGYIENTLQLQTRNELIDKTFKPFGLPEIIEPLIQIVEKVKSALNYNFLIYGEIFGKIIPAMNYYDSNSATVLGSEHYFFRAFDLYNVDEQKYLKYSDAITLFEKVGLPHLPILNIHVETVKDLYEIVENYPSAFSKKCVEGFVVKKNEDESKIMRHIFKIKRKEFRADNVKLLNKNSIKSYVNYNRFLSAHSKYLGDLEKIKSEMIVDATQDMFDKIIDEVTKEVEQNYERFVKKYQKEQERKKQVE